MRGPPPERRSLERPPEKGRSRLGVGPCLVACVPTLALDLISRGGKPIWTSSGRIGRPSTNSPPGRCSDSPWAPSLGVAPLVGRPGAARAPHAQHGAGVKQRGRVAGSEGPLKVSREGGPAKERHALEERGLFGMCRADVDAPGSDVDRFGTPKGGIGLRRSVQAESVESPQASAGCSQHDWPMLGRLSTADIRARLGGQRETKYRSNLRNSFQESRPQVSDMWPCEAPPHRNRTLGDQDQTRPTSRGGVRPTTNCRCS